MIVNHLDVVQDLHARQPPVSGDLASCFAFEQRVLAELARRFPTERWGYLANGGENTLFLNGEWIKVGRVCGPDAQLYKILTDIPTTNAPIWSDDGNLTVDFPGSAPAQWYRPFEGAIVVPVPPVPLPPVPLPPEPPPVVVPPTSDLVQALARIEGMLASNASANLAFGSVLNNILGALQTNESMQVLRHADVVAHFDELKRILAGWSFEGEVQIRYLGTAKITLKPVKA